MKKIVLILIGILLNSYAFSQENYLSKEKALQLVKEIVSFKDKNVYISNSLFDANTAIKTIDKQVLTPNYKCWFVFIDEEPFQSWWHNCKYIYVNALSGECETVCMKYPPTKIDWEKVQEKQIVSIPKLFNFRSDKLMKSTKINQQNTSNKWAVIISGGASPEYNYERYWNDCSAIYSTLIKKYGYIKEHIIVLMADGTDPAPDRRLNNGQTDSSPLDLDGDGIADIQYSATKANMINVFNQLSSRLSNNDDLFIYSTDHGGSINGKDVMMYLWNSENITDKEFSEQVNKVNTKSTNIVMEQCFSGGFIDNLQANNRVIATACDYFETSKARSDLAYDEFVYHWTSAVLGKTPLGLVVDADTNKDGDVSMEEAFNYAKKNDDKNETPQYLSIAQDLGQKMFLCDRYIICGPTTYTKSAVYSVSNVPNGARVIWSYPYRNNCAPFPHCYSDTPSMNMITLENVYNFSVSAKLTAKIIYNNDTIIVNKTVMSEQTTDNIQRGTFIQDECYINNSFRPKISGELNVNGGPTFLHQCGRAYITLFNMVGKTLVLDQNGGKPTLWSYIPSDGLLILELPIYSGGVPFTFLIKGSNPQYDRKLLIFSTSSDLSKQTNGLSKTIRVSGDSQNSQRKISIENLTSEDQIIDKKWNLEIHSVSKGLQCRTNNIIEKDVVVDTSNWKDGVYVVKVTYGNEVLTNKMVVSH